MTKHRDTSMDKRQNKFMGMTLDEARAYALTFVKGCQENSSEIKFVYWKWNWTLRFENGICCETNRARNND